MAKKITKASDLEGLSILDDIEVDFFTSKEGNDKRIDFGIYSGSFNKNNKQYFVLSKVFPLQKNPEALFVNSSVYRVNDSSVSYGMNVVNGLSSKDKLKEELSIHLDILRR